MTIKPAPAHVPVLDGIRGLAILLVMLCHNTVFGQYNTFDQWFNHLSWWGWLGVDLFFVLSGYLITGILLDTKANERYFRTFYARRVLRIFPLYYAVAALALLVLPRFLPPDKAARFGKIAGDEAYYWLYLQNIPIARAGTTRHAVLDITWSLAIEEQFYLVWPTVVYLCSPRALRRVCLALFGVSLGARLVGGLVLHLVPFSLYVLTPCRMEALAAGAFVALQARAPGGLAALVPRARIVAPIAGLAALAIVVAEKLAGLGADDIAGHGPISIQIGITLNALCFGALLVLVVEAPRESALHRLFASRTMRFYGFYAYGIYLVHVPIRALVRDRLYGPRYMNPPHAFLSIGGSELPGQLVFYVVSGVPVAIVAWLSYHLFEKQFLKLKRFFPSG